MDGGWWVDVDGYVLPKPLSGHPALELCNTRSGWGEPPHPRQEYLRTYAHLVVAAREAGVLESGRAGELLRRSQRESPAMSRELERARDLRRDAYAVMSAGGSAAALDRIGRAVSAARSRQVLVRAEGRTRWTFSGPPRPADPVDSFVLAMGDLLVSDDATRVRACPGHGCGWLFLDGSGRRRWCQMAVCGNRAKQARLRERD